MGCILYELVCHHRAFNDDWSTLDYRGAKQFPPELSNHDRDITRTFLPVVNEMLQIDPQRRPSAIQLCDRFKSQNHRPTSITFVEDQAVSDRLRSEDLQVVPSDLHSSSNDIIILDSTISMQGKDSIGQRRADFSRIWLPLKSGQLA